MALDDPQSSKRQMVEAPSQGVVMAALYGVFVGMQALKLMPLVALVAVLRRRRRSLDGIFEGLGMKALMMLAAISFRETARNWRSRPSSVHTMALLPCMKAYVDGIMKHRVNDVFVDWAEASGRSTYHVDAPGLGHTIITGDPRNVEHMLKTNFEGYIKGPDFYDRLDGLLGKGIFNSDGEQWYPQRKVASRLFTQNNFRQHMWSTFLRHARSLAALLEGSSGAVDMFALFNRFTLDSIGEVGFGHDIGSLENPSNPVLQSFDAAQVLVAERFTIRCVTWKLERLLGGTAERQLRRHEEALDAYARTIAREGWKNFDTAASPAAASPAATPSTTASSPVRRGSPKAAGRSDFLSLFIREMRQETGEVILSPQNEKYLRDVVMNFLIAGRDTTAQALSWTFLLLAQHPSVESKLLAELNEAFPDGQLDFEQVMHLEYTQCVINEVLRLYPSVPKNIKVAKTSDVLPDGTVVPPGCNIAHVPYMMGRLPEIWGEDAKQFKPERWQGKETMDLYSYPAFHAGPRECLGRRMAHLEMKVALAVLLPRFHFHLAVDPSAVCYSDSLTLPMATTLPMLAQSRA